jgi:integrase
MAEARPPSLVPGDALTIEDLGRRYLSHLDGNGRKPGTATAVESILRVWLVPFFGQRDLRQVGERDVHDLVAMMRAGDKPGEPRSTGDRYRDRPLSAKSIRNYIGYLSALLGFAERKGWLAVNIAKRVELPARPRSEEVRFLDPVEIDALADAALEGPYQAIDHALYLTAAMTGLRQGELIALRWRDVDWTAGRIRVRQNYVRGRFGTPKSRRSTRSVPMADAVAGDLDRLYQATRWQADGDLVFANARTGGPMERAGVLRRFKRALRAARLDETHRFHDLRHTFGTRMAGAGVPMRTLQEWMGHRDLDTTLIYADYAPSAHEAAFVAAAFDRGTKGGTNLTESHVISEQPNVEIAGGLA